MQDCKGYQYLQVEVVQEWVVAIGPPLSLPVLSSDTCPLSLWTFEKDSLGIILNYLLTD